MLLWNLPWNFHREFHGLVPVELSVEIPQKIPGFCFCGNSIESSTVLSLWKFQRKFHSFVSVEIPEKVPLFCVGLLGQCPTRLCHVHQLHSASSDYCINLHSTASHAVNGDIVVDSCNDNLRLLTTVMSHII